MAQRIITLILLLCSTSAIAGLFDAPGSAKFTPADQAFTFDFRQDGRTLTLAQYGEMDVSRLQKIFYC